MTIRFVGWIVVLGQSPAGALAPGLLPEDSWQGRHPVRWAEGVGHRTQGPAARITGQRLSWVLSRALALQWVLQNQKPPSVLGPLLRHLVFIFPLTSVSPIFLIF